MHGVPCLCDGRADIVCTPQRCDIAGPGAPGDPNQCRECWRRLNRPASRTVLPCRHLGEPTGETRPCQTCNKKVEVKLFGCAVHGTCSQEQLLSGVQCCKICPNRAPAHVRDVYISPGRYEQRTIADGVVVANMGAGGIGDGLQGLLAVGAMKQANPSRTVAYAVSAPTAETADAASFVTLFDGYDLLLRHDHDKIQDVPAGAHQGDIQLNRGYNREVKTRGSRPRWLRYCDNAGVHAPALPALRDPARLRQLGQDMAGVVCLVPFAAFKDREWRVEGYLTLERDLRAAGYRTVVLDNRGDRVGAFRGEKLLGASAERVSAAILNAAALVGNDSGMAHLAGCLGTPAVVLCGHVTGRQIYGCYPSVRVLEGKLYCQGCWWQDPCDPQRCGNGNCASMQTILPAEILATVDEITGKSRRVPLPVAAIEVEEPDPPPGSGETSKARKRRKREGWFAKWLRLPGIDIGCGNDLVQPDFRPWDVARGDSDAAVMAGVGAASYQTVYTSHLLEHIPRERIAMALANWWRILRPGGNLIIVVPHRDLYERRKTLPSRWNGDHKTFWLPETREPPDTFGLREVLANLLPEGELLSLRVIDTGWHPVPDEQHSPGEYSIEAIVRKPEAGDVRV